MWLSEGAERNRASLETKSPWHDFAKRDAFAYILTGLRRGDRREFWRSGETTVSRELLPVMDEFRINRGTALEIGCGVGRLVFPIAQHFQQVIGVDISHEMIRQARAFSAQRKVTNVKFLSVCDPEQAGSGWHELDGQVDFIYSLLVFQHIEEFDVIKQYLGLVRSWLSRTGVAYLQFDTRAETMLYRVKNALPDPMLPPNLRRGIRRIRRKTSELEKSFEVFGLTIAKNIGELTKDHRYVLRRDQREP